VTVPEAHREDLLSLIRRQAAKYGDRTFMTFGDGASMSFRELERRVNGFRGRLEQMDVGPDERVALMLKNSLFYPVAWLGTVSAGSIAVPINSRLAEIDTRYLLEHSGSAALVVDEETEPVAAAAAPETMREIIVARAGDAMEEIATDDEVIAPPLSGGTIANIQYTSGTTGFPKGCLLSHRYWQRMGDASVAAMRISEEDVLLTSQPHSYIDPQWNVVAALRSGAHLVLLDSFHPSTFMRSVAEFGVTIFYCLGVMPTLLLKQPTASWDFDNRLSRVYCSAIPPDQHPAIEERWGVPWFEAFGMTETGLNTFVSEADHDRLVGSGCIGRAMAHNEAIVADEEDKELPAGEVGQLLLRGVGFMQGYYRDPAETARFFANGWAHTGDLVARDGDGLLYYRGRSKEMIRRAGENIAPVEVETSLIAHPDVVECAVNPVPDPDVGEEIKAYVVLHDRAAPDAAALAEFLRSRIARFKVPRYWQFRDSLPHTPSERVAKHELEEAPDWRQNTLDLRRD
jgi:crotonobetaine/carnitine-CoA ligase